MDVYGFGKNKYGILVRKGLGKSYVDGFFIMGIECEDICEYFLKSIYYRRGF